MNLQTNCNMRNIDTLIFDLGGVLVDWNPEYVYKDIFKDEAKRKWFLTQVCSPTWNAEQDAGRTIAEAEALKIAEFPSYEAEIKMFYKEWEHMFRGPIEENVALFKKLKASGNYKLYALTNWSAEKWDKALELFPFFNDFDGVVVSGQEKTRKPFKEIYQLMIDRYDIIPEKTLFMDDNQQNVEAFKLFGVQGIHIKPYTKLLYELEELGIALS